MYPFVSITSSMILGILGFLGSLGWFRRHQFRISALGYHGDFSGQGSHINAIVLSYSLVFPSSAYPVFACPFAPEVVPAGPRFAIALVLGCLGILRLRRKFSDSSVFLVLGMALSRTQACFCALASARDFAHSVSRESVPATDNS